ncbi:MAG: thioredoxin-like domain-containing protein [Bacteroidales bacterium]|nr:thioredoxin-like domain-containing protein [Bacteroidales bacterium]
MRSFKSYFLLLLILIPLTAYVTKDVRPEEGLTPGSFAPEIQIDENGKELLSSMRGKYLLLQFWAAYDGESRMNNLLLYNSIKRHYANRVHNLSLSFDTNRTIFEETVSADGMDPNTQLNVVQGENSDVYRNYNLSNGYTNYLIDPNGVVVAKNVSPQKLNEILN